MLISKRFSDINNIVVPQQSRRFGGFIYLIENVWGTTKVGQSHDPYDRIKGLETAGGTPIVRAHIFGPFLCSADAEQEAKKILSVYKFIGEWHKVDFESAFTMCSNLFHDIGDGFKDDAIRASRFRFPLFNVRCKDVHKIYPHIDDLCMRHASRETQEKVMSSRRLASNAVC
jgi:hypothetical protein